MNRRRNRKAQTIMTITKVVVAILAIILGAYTQVIILQPGLHYVYIGKTVVVFITAAIIYYNAFMNLLKYFWFE